MEKSLAAVKELDLFVLPMDAAQLRAPVDPHRQIASPTPSSPKPIKIRPRESRLHNWTNFVALENGSRGSKSGHGLM